MTEIHLFCSLQHKDCKDSDGLDVLLQRRKTREHHLQKHNSAPLKLRQTGELFLQCPGVLDDNPTRFKPNSYYLGQSVVRTPLFKTSIHYL